MHYRKKPVIIEAVQVTEGNYDEVKAFVPSNCEPAEGHSWLISTMEGVMRADCGDYIIKGVKDEFYPCKPDIFEATYDAVREDGSVANGVTP